MNAGMSYTRCVPVLCVLIMVGSLALIAVLSVLHPVPASASNPTSVTPYVATSTATSSPAPHQPSPSTIQTELQQLEIRQLNQQTDKWATVRAWLPASTALVALIAAAVGVLTYLADARKDRRLRLEDKVEENVGILVEYATDINAGIGRLNNALRNLQALLRVAGTRRQRVAIEKRVSHAIAEVVSYDLNLNDMRQARFDALALDNWSAYRRLLRKNDELRDDVFYRYVTALRNARMAVPGLYEAVRVGSDGDYQFESDVDDVVLQHFGTLVASYRRHVSFTANDLERQQRVADFGAALENQELAEQIFGDPSAAAAAGFR